MSGLFGYRTGRTLLEHYADQMGSLLQQQYHLIALQCAKDAAERAARDTEAANIALRQQLDTSERLQNALELVAKYDVLTGLPNRYFFTEQLASTLSVARRRSGICALLMIDIDRFKDLNDTISHEVGDDILVQVGTRLRHCARTSDTVARLSGDEFAVILTDLAYAEDAHILARRISDSFADAFTVDRHSVALSASVGIAMFPGDADDAAQLQRNADMALSRAKDDGGNCYRFYDATLHEEVQRKSFLERELKRALERNQLLVYYQPKICLRTGAVAGAEALLRWNHPDGWISPVEFIPLAERTGLITDIGEWVLRTACADFRRWHQQGYDGSVAVNVSAVQFRRGNVANTISGILAKSGIDPRRVELEVTESSVMTDMRDAIQVLKDVRELGVNISIDDFGTGYSSLSYLSELPIDTLKIDRSFIKDVDAKEAAATITRAIIALGHSLGVKLVAEGVATQPQLDFVSEGRCDEAQGFLFAQALPAAEFERFIARTQPALVLS